MPRFDGTGPQGQGPMSGRGEGYCAARLPEPRQPGYGHTGRGPYHRPYPTLLSPPTAYGLGRRPRWGLGRGFWGRGRGLTRGRGWR